MKEFQICSDLQSCFDKLGLNTDVALATNVERANELSSSGAFCFGQSSHSIFEYELKFFVRKVFPFRDEFNKFIGDALRAGLIDKWRRDHQKIGGHFQTMETVTDVNVEKLTGVWIIICILNAVAILQFVVERIVYSRVRQPKTISWFWMFAEILISPDRCFLLDDLYC